MQIIVIIQARMGSSRLPGKVLLPLGEKPVLMHVVERCRRITGISEVIVATSTLSSDNLIFEWCEANKVTCFRGSEQDVLARYYECASLYHPDYVIRATSDCPFLDHNLASQSVQLMSEKSADIIFLNGKVPRGLATEIMSFSALKKMYGLGKEERHREHVTYYAYEYPNEFKSIQLHVPLELQHPQLRLTLDTVDDYKLCCAVTDHFATVEHVTAREIVSYLLEHPEIALLNAHIEQKPVV